MSGTVDQHSQRWYHHSMLSDAFPASAPCKGRLFTLCWMWYDDVPGSPFLLEFSNFHSDRSHAVCLSMKEKPDQKKVQLFSHLDQYEREASLTKSLKWAVCITSSCLITWGRFCLNHYNNYHARSLQPAAPGDYDTEIMVLVFFMNRGLVSSVVKIGAMMSNYSLSKTDVFVLEPMGKFVTITGNRPQQ